MLNMQTKTLREDLGTVEGKHRVVEIQLEELLRAKEARILDLKNDIAVQKAKYNRLQREFSAAETKIRSLVNEVKRLGNKKR